MESRNARTTQRGKPLKGHYELSYWTASLHKEKKLHSEDIFLDDYLSKITNNLSIYSDFFREIESTGGNIEYFIGIYADKNFGLTYPSSLLKSIGKLNIDLALDIYPK